MSTRLLIAQWEFLRFFKWKSEVLGLFFTAALFSAGFMITPLMDWVRSTDDQTLVLVGEFPIAGEFSYLPVTIERRPETPFPELIAALGDGEIDAIAVWNPVSRNVALSVMKTPGWLGAFEAAAGHQTMPERLAAASITEDQFAQILMPAPITLNYHPDATPRAGKLQKLIGVLAVVLPMVGVFSSFSYFFVSITAEKQNRLGEQLLSTVGAKIWLDGKLIGLTALCTKSIITVGLMSIVGLALYLKFTGEIPEPGYVSWTKVGWALAFCVLAIAFWSAFMASVAATINDPNSSSRSSLMLVPGLFMLLPLLALDVPDSLGVTLLSVIPLTSTAFMPMRLVLSDVPAWQLLISIALMIGAIATVRLAAQKILQTSILMYGREPAIKEIWRSVRH